MYDTATWTQQRHFRASTSDAAELSWSPDGGCLALLEGALAYRVAVHAVDGRCVEGALAYRVVVHAVDGRCVHGRCVHGSRCVHDRCCELLKVKALST